MEVRQGRLGGKVDKEEDQKTLKTHEDLIIYQKAMVNCYRLRTDTSSNFLVWFTFGD